MKKKFPLMGVYCVTFLFMCIMAIAMLCSCEHRSGRTLASTGDTIKTECVACTPLMDVEINNVGDFIQLQQALSEEYEADSIIRNLPSQSTGVVSVCLKHEKPTTVRAILEEYLQNQQIYDNLPANNSSKSAAVVEEQPITKVEPPTESVVSINMRDTIIDGKKYRVDTKLIRYETE